MKISEKGLTLIKKWEGFYLKAYQDCVGVWTIGYGITNADKSITGITIKKGLTISKATAEKWLRESLDKKYGPKVMRYNDNYHWNQNQYDALVSFAYNIGSIDQLTANGKRSKDEIARKMLEYSKAGGKFVKGLYSRRKEEHNLFCTPAADQKQDKEKKKEEYTMSTIKKGSENRTVMVWQVILKITIDGVFGEKTEKATKEFQKAHGLTADGIVGPFTWSAGIGTLP